MRSTFTRSSLALIAALTACGGGSRPTATSGAAVNSPVRVSTTNPLVAGCGTGSSGGPVQNYAMGSAIQPQVAVDPANPKMVIGVWEQDRWSGIGARAIVTARSNDGGLNWAVPQPMPFSTCGANTGPGARFDRASDPWVSVGRSGSVFASALAFSAAGFLGPGGASTVFVSHSNDSGLTWDSPVALMADQAAADATGPFYFDDRDSVTADPNSDAAYVVWDRLTSDPAASGPTWLARTVDGGITWATSLIYDPGPGAQTFNNQIVILTDGTLLDFFTLFTSGFTTSLQVIRSTNQGVSWSTSPVKIADLESLGTTNPLTQGSIRDSALMAQAAVANDGRIGLVWQQYFATSGAVANDGIALAVSADGGLSWTAPTQINADLSVAAFSPTVRFLPNGRIATTYYDLRDFKSGTGLIDTSLWLATSADGTPPWTETRIAGPFDLNRAPLTDLTPQLTETALFLGDNQGLAAAGPGLIALFTATDLDGAHVYALPATP